MFVLLLWIIVGVKHLRGLKHDIFEHWEIVDEKLRKRTDLVPMLIETVRGYKDHESTEKLIRDRMTAAREYGAGGRKIEYEHDLTRQINKVVDLGRIYKDLAKDTNFLEVRKEIDDLEKGIESETKAYNEIVRRYNNHRKFIFLRPLSAAFGLKMENIFEFEI